MTSTGDDDDRTRMPAAKSKLHSASLTRRPAAEAGQDHFGDDDSSLPPGTVIGSYEITEKIGKGGFGVVYLAWDQLLHQKVALKEYLPSEIAGRRGGTSISLRSDRYRETFEKGLESFIDEARRMVRFDHPSLARAITYLEANGTAYIVMPFYEGVNVRDTVSAMTQPPDEAWLKSILRPLTEALEVIHSRDFYHRDIAPDNIMLLADTGKPLLLDFGAARQAFSEKTQALTTILKPGYAPLEQYGEVPGLKQGPWTDVYALAAVVHWIITGKKPPQPVGRMVNDTYVPLTQVAAGRYSESFLKGVDRALTVLPDKRTRDVAAFRRDLGLDVVDTPPSVESLPTNLSDPDATIIHQPREKSSPVRSPQKEAAVALGAANRKTSSGLRSTWLAAGAGLIAVSVWGVWWAWQPSKTPSPSNTAPATADAESPQAKAPSSPAPLPAPVARGASGVSVVVPPLPQAASAAAKDGRVMLAMPTSPAAAVEQLRSQSFSPLHVDASLSLSTWSNQQQPPVLSATFRESSYVYVLARKEGAKNNELVMLHPTGKGSPQRSTAGSPWQLPGTSWAGIASTPGAWQLLVIAARAPFAPTTMGWNLPQRSSAMHLAFKANGAVRQVPAHVLGGAPCSMTLPDCATAFGTSDPLTLNVLALETSKPQATEERKPDLLKQQVAKSPDSSEQERPIKMPGPDDRPKASGRSDPECASLLQRISLGVEPDNALIQRYKSLGCR